MGWFDYYGLAVMAIIMIPNIVYAVMHKNDPAVIYKNKAAVVCEQIGRYGCFVLMIFNIPYTYFDFWFDSALTVYLSVNGALCLAYIIFWIVFRNKNGKPRALALSVTPSVIFLFSGVISADIPLLVFAVLFAASHILISYKTAATNNKKRKTTVEDKLKNEAIAILIIILLACVVISVLFGTQVL